MLCTNIMMIFPSSKTGWIYSCCVGRHHHSARTPITSTRIHTHAPAQTHKANLCHATDKSFCSAHDVFLHHLVFTTAFVQRFQLDVFSVTHAGPVSGQFDVAYTMTDTTSHLWCRGQRLLLWDENWGSELLTSTSTKQLGIWTRCANW